MSLELSKVCIGGEVQDIVYLVNDNPGPSTAIVLPFIAPPSSPASFLQSDPPSATQSPAGLLSLTSLSVNAYSLGGTAAIFSIGPYAYETQLVSPPVFSTFTTEPSTAPFTPPPESVQLTTPSSPEVPFAQLLTSSLERTRRNSGTNLKFALSHHELQPYQQYPGSPGFKARFWIFNPRWHGTWLKAGFWISDPRWYGNGFQAKFWISDPRGCRTGLEGGFWIFDTRYSGPCFSRQLPSREPDF
ncbi:hypothetical protein CJ030_MR7G015313 [Morella rubra]|uniref:Uncharacterized protein n=1 Tax=Morella rubra TaxID=262757 RepID=A0A6A1UWP0_9ROSI|nr:hypothetical protein CJ030_MR7G015313 [Morella rubra]